MVGSITTRNPERDTEETIKPQNSVFRSPGEEGGRRTVDSLIKGNHCVRVSVSS